MMDEGVQHATVTGGWSWHRAYKVGEYELFVLKAEGPARMLSVAPNGRSLVLPLRGTAHVECMPEPGVRTTRTLHPGAAFAVIGASDRAVLHSTGGAELAQLFTPPTAEPPYQPAPTNHA